MASGEKSGVARNAPGDMGSATGRPPFTTKRVSATWLAGRRSAATPAASISSPMRGVVSSALLGPVS